MLKEDNEMAFKRKFEENESRNFNCEAHDENFEQENNVISVES